MKMNKEKQIDMITELLVDFDEMGFAPTTLCPNPEAYAIDWRRKITEELKGYCKASEVVRELCGMLREDLRGLVDADYLERLLKIYEKKYTEEGKSNG